MATDAWLTIYRAWLNRTAPDMSAEVAAKRIADETEHVADMRRWGRTEAWISDWAGRGFLAGRSTGGDEADINANYPGGLAAFRRDEPVDRTPYHKGEIDGY